MASRSLPSDLLPEVLPQKPRRKRRRLVSSLTQRRRNFATLTRESRLGTAEDIDKLARRQVRPTKVHNEECRRLLKLMGIPVVVVRLRFAGEIGRFADSELVS
mgnify:CR=1 FL=1